MSFFRRREIALLTTVIVLSSLIRFSSLDRFSLWYDELGSVYYVKSSLWWIWGAGAADEVNPPLYYTLLKLWVALFGSTEPMVRLLSVLPTLFTVPVIYRAGRLIAGTTAGLVAALLFATATIQIEYALDVRCYSLLQMLAGVAILYTIRFLREVEIAAAETPWQTATRRWPLIVALAASLYTHNSAVFFIAGLSAAVVIALMPRLRSPAGRRGLPGIARAWVLINGIALLLAAPQLAIVLSLSASGALDWIPRPTPAYFLSVVRTLLLGGAMPYSIWQAKLVLGLLAGILAWSAWRIRTDRLTVAIGVALPLCGLGLILVVSLSRPILLPRTVLWMTIPAYLVIGAAFAEQRQFLPRLVLLCSLMVAHSITFGAFLAHGEREPWRALVAEIAALTQPGDLFVAIDGRTNCVLDYYGGDLIPAANRRLLAAGPELRVSLPPADLDCERSPPLDTAGMRTALSDGARLWFLTRGERTVETLKAVCENLKGQMDIVLWRQVGPDLILARLDPRAP
jgi:uncharacterized membrane protein